MAGRTKKLLDQCPNCVFCGGVKPATSRDHQPPKIFFTEKNFPAGYEFAACELCNNGFSQVEHVAAYFIRIFDPDPTAQNDADTNRFFQYIRHNFPSLFPMADLSANDVRRALREHGLRKPVDVFASEIPLVRFEGNPFNEISFVIRKITKAMFYKHIGRPAPVSGAVQDIVQFNILIADPVIENMFGNALANLETPRPHRITPTRNFQYQWDYQEKDKIFGCLMRFGGSCRAVGAIVEDKSIIENEAEHPWHPIAESAPDLSHLMKSNPPE